MSAIKGKRNSKHKSEQKFATLQEFTDNKVGLDTLPKQLSALTLVNIAITSITAVIEASKTVGYDIVIPAHGMKQNDVIWVRTGAALNSEIYADSIIDVNTVRISGVLPVGLAAADEVIPCRHMSMRLDADGNLILAQGPIRFLKDAVSVEVTEDTVTPANNVPLPVKLTGVTGDINITANDLNVQLSHIGVNADSTQIGDGVEILEIDADGSATVRDADAITELTLLNTKLNTLGQKATVGSAPVVLSTEQEAILSGILADTTSIDGTDFATQTTLAALLAAFSAEDFATEVTLAAILGDTTSLDGKDFATQTTLAALLAAFSAEDFATETTLAALAAEDFATQTTLSALNAAFAAEDFAQEVTLAAQAVDIGSIEAKVSTEAKQDDIITELQSLITTVKTPLDVVEQLDVGLYDTSVGGQNITDVLYRTMVAVTTTAIQKIQIVEDIGEFMALYTGAAAAETFLCNLPLGGGDVEVAIPAASRISIRALVVGKDIQLGNITMNLLG